MAEQPLILIADDESDFREIFSAKLSAAGYRIVTAENGEVALQKMAEEKPNLVLMDVRMPVMDGATTVLKMREDPNLKDVKVVFLTSLGDPRGEMEEVSRKFSKDFGAQGYFKKTENLDTLAERIAGLVK